MVDDLAEGFSRAIHAVVRAVFRLVLEAIGRLFSALGRMFISLYDRFFQRLRHAVRSRILAHGLAIALLMLGGFVFGFGASAFYHQSPTHQTAPLDVEQ